MTRTMIIILAVVALGGAAWYFLNGGVSAKTAFNPESASNEIINRLGQALYGETPSPAWSAAQSLLAPHRYAWDITLLLTTLGSILTPLWERPTHDRSTRGVQAQLAIREAGSTGTIITART